VVLPIIGGYFVDNVLGMRMAAFVFASFILLGNIEQKQYFYFAEKLEQKRAIFTQNTAIL
jgi:dipeptide/tripeptide permease